MLIEIGSCVAFRSPIKSPDRASIGLVSDHRCAGPVAFTTGVAVPLRSRFFFFEFCEEQHKDDGHFKWM